MLKLPKQGILLVPAHWHLPFYRELLDRNGNTFQYEVYSLSSYVQRFIKKENPDDLTLAYQSRELLQQMDRNNAFYASRHDSRFIQSCLDFLKWTKTFNIHSFPATEKKNTKEDFLQEILTLLDTHIALVEDTFDSIELPDQTHVYILEKVFSKQEQYWVDRLLEKGASFLSFDENQTRQYYSTANAKKQARLAAQMIVDNQWEADSVSIHLCQDKDIPVMTQMLEAYQIPYTLLKEKQISDVPARFSALLRWVKEEDLESFQSVLETCFSDARDVLEYLDTCPDAFPDFQKRMVFDYQDNTFLKEKEYQALQALEEKALDWIKTHPFRFALNDFEAMAALVQEQIASPTKEDLSAFSSIQSLIVQAKDHIKTKDDLTLLMDAIEEVSQNQRAASLQGVCVASMEDLCGLKEHVFLLGAHSQQFPNLKVESGLFNEAYIQKIEGLPSLQHRLATQKEQRFHMLEQAQDLIVILPESNYDRKGNQPSIELNAWMETPPAFADVAEADTYHRPSFTLSKQASEELFLSQNTLKGSVSSLEMFAKCPFQYFLKHGLRLREPDDWSDISQRGSLLHKILEKAANEHQKGYASISEAQLKQYIEEEFTFVQSLFPHRQFEFDLQKNDLAMTLQIIFERLAHFEQNWHMHIDKEEYRYETQIPLSDCILSLKGIIDRVDTSDSSFAIFDYKSSEKKFEEKKFRSGQALQLATYAVAYQEHSQKIPVGSFFISLKPKPITQPGHTTKGEYPETDPAEIRETFVRESAYKGIAFQDLSIYDDAVKSTKETVSFPDIKQQWETVLDSVVADIRKGSYPPEHVEGACQWCKFESVCRNARREVEKESRIKEEDA